MKSYFHSATICSENTTPASSKLCIKKSFNNPFPLNELNLESAQPKSVMQSLSINTHKLPNISKYKGQMRSKSKNSVAIYCKASFLKKFLEDDIKVTIGSRIVSPIYGFPKRSSLMPLAFFKKGAARKPKTIVKPSYEVLHMNSRNEFPLRSKKDCMIRSINILKQFATLNEKGVTKESNSTKNKCNKLSFSGSKLHQI